MAAATDVDLVLDDLDFDVIQALDMNLLADDDQEFGGREDGDGDGDGDSGAAATCGWLLAGLVGDGEESSPADTDDGLLAPAAGNDDDSAEAMSAYVAELERFLLEDDDDDAPCGQQAEDLLGVVDHYFAGDQLRLASVAGRTDGEEEENDDGVLAAREDQQSASRKRASFITGVTARK